MASEIEMPRRREGLRRRTINLLCCLFAMDASHAASTSHWYRGNTHTHTRFSDLSDANETPAYVAQWFKTHGYQFVVITDHEHLTDARQLNQSYAEDGKFLVLPGQEITQMIAEPSHPGGVRHAHVNGINTSRVIMPITPNPARGVSLADAYARNLREIASAGGVAQINHPNLAWSVTLQDLLPVQGPFLFEIWNAFPTSNNLGGTDEHDRYSPSAEELWDALLTAGKVVWGVASDDSHTYHQFDDPSAPNPGRGWVTVRAAELSAKAITEALVHGDFYASTGIVLADYAASPQAISIKIRNLPEWSPALQPSTRYVTKFIGKNGRVLATVAGMTPTYRIRGDEGYVRAAIVDSDGRRGWTQPVFF